jgi:hypothetical protein
MKTLFKKALKKQPGANLALLDATNEEPGKTFGTIVNVHRTRSMAMIDAMDFEEGTSPRPKTRIVHCLLLGVPWRVERDHPYSGYSEFRHVHTVVPEHPLHAVQFLPSESQVVPGNHPHSHREDKGVPSRFARSIAQHGTNPGDARISCRKNSCCRKRWQKSERSPLGFDLDSESAQLVYLVTNDTA